MTIYQVVYYNQFSEKVADFGFYEDELDAEQRAFEVRRKTPVDSGKVRVEDIFVHDSTQKAEKLENEKDKKEEMQAEKESMYIYDLKPHE